VVLTVSLARGLRASSPLSLPSRMAPGCTIADVFANGGGPKLPPAAYALAFRRCESPAYLGPPVLTKAGRFASAGRHGEDATSPWRNQVLELFRGNSGAQKIPIAPCEESGLADAVRFAVDYAQFCRGRGRVDANGVAVGEAMLSPLANPRDNSPLALRMQAAERPRRPKSAPHRPLPMRRTAPTRSFQSLASDVSLSRAAAARTRHGNGLTC
jgi:hypothetical protein